MTGFGSRCFKLGVKPTKKHVFLEMSHILTVPSEPILTLAIFGEVACYFSAKLLLVYSIKGDENDIFTMPTGTSIMNHIT